jgi:small-conductance mechanosensitive channel
MTRFGIDPALVTGALAVLAISIVLGAVVEKIVRRVSRRERAGLTRSVATHTAGAFRTLVPVFGFLLWLTMVGVSQQALLLPVKIATILTSGWFLIGVVRGTVHYTIDRYDISHADNLRARRMQTQIRLLGRVVGTLVVLATAAGVLMTIPGIRNVGISLFASAGIAGLAVGLAARPVLANILAGIQIALTQPIRLDDVIVVEGEWGRVEEINLTFVVVRIWDLRRLVLPISYFIERPFQNWTRTSASILGAVSIQADFKLPLDDVRAAFNQALEASQLWDGDTAVVQVTDSTDRTMQIRLLMSAADSGTAWDLRCYIREHMIDYLQREHADALPRVRLEPTNRTAAT